MASDTNCVIKKKNRCPVCNKKMGLLPFECKCGKFFCIKHNIDPKKVETHFALLKRTAKKDNVEIFRVTSGPRKIQNATNLLVKAVKSIYNKAHFKRAQKTTHKEIRARPT